MARSRTGRARSSRSRTSRSSRFVPLGSASVPATAIAVAGLRKAYGGIQALAGVDLAVESGVVHAVVGENGAGKSTLMKILAGALRADEGEVMVAGETVQLSTPAGARRPGVGILYQELRLFPERSV